MELYLELFFFGENETNTKFSVSGILGWMGQLCVGVGFFFLLLCFLFFVLIMFTICLNHSVFYKDSTSSPLPSPTQAFEAVRRCLKNSTKYQSKSNFAHIYIYIQKRNISVIYNKEHYFLMKADWSLFLPAPPLPCFLFHPHPRRVGGEGGSRGGAGSAPSLSRVLLAEESSSPRH